MKRGIHQAFTLVFSVMIFGMMITAITNYTIDQTITDFEQTKTNITKLEEKLDANLKLSDEFGGNVESGDNVRIVVENTGRIDLTALKIFLAKKSGQIVQLNNISGGPELNILRKDQETSFMGTGKLKTRDVLFVATDQESYYFYIY